MAHDPEEVLGFWFPDDGHWETAEGHGAFWRTRMQGGMDEEICARFAPLAEDAARCKLDHWADTPRGRLALILALDQFPRSLWRGTPGAYAQDIKAARLALEGIAIGHYHALRRGFERQFYLIAISHCEGPDHLARMDRLVELSRAQDDLIVPALEALRGDALRHVLNVRNVIERFGRHPHRNPILGRISSPEEEAYIATGEFPHNPPAAAPEADSA
ncbi:MAG: DUF924 family protein [Pseudomonadota bacterium]